MASLELSMIVKNGEQTLARCLASVRPIVDEIVIGDTGSTDSTTEIARQYGARIVPVTWEDDFSKARNAVLSEGRSDWILFLDADELLDDRAVSEIPPLLTNREVMGYDIRIWNYVPTLTNRMLNQPALPNPHRIEAARAYSAYVEHVNVRLFRRHPEIYFEGRVHEGVADRMKRIGLQVATAEFVIHHLGTAEDGVPERARKMEYYRKLGRKKLTDSPHDFRTYCELGLTELEYFHNPRAALGFLKKAIELKPDSKALWTYVGICHVRVGDLHEGMHALHRAQELGARDAVNLEAMGDAQYSLDQFAEAEKNYKAAMAAGSQSSVLESKLGVCEVRLGVTASGLVRIRQAISREPEFGELYDILVAAALFANDRALAAQAAEHRLKVGTPAAERYVLAAGILAQLGEWERAMQVVRSGCDNFPENAQMQAAMAELKQKLSHHQ